MKTAPAGTSFFRRAMVPSVIMILILGNIAIAFLYFHERDNTIARALNQYPLVDPARTFIPQSDYVATVQPLREELREIAKAYDADISIYVEFLNTGANISINPDSYIFPASLIKLHLAMAAMKKVERGEWKLESELILTPDDRDDKSGSPTAPLWQKPVGTRFTIEELLQELLVNSDNTAHNILYRNMDFADVQNVMEELGLESLFTEGGKMNAKEYSRLFRALYSASFLTREHSQFLLTLLDDATFNEYLSHEVPQDVAFPHKYGENTELRVFSDSGIVYVSNRPYLITVMLSGNPDVPLETDNARARALMHDISSAAYNYFTK